MLLVLVVLVVFSKTHLRRVTVTRNSLAQNRKKRFLIMQLWKCLLLGQDMQLLAIESDHASRLSQAAPCIWVRHLTFESQRLASKWWCLESESGSASRQAVPHIWATAPCTWVRPRRASESQRLASESQNIASIHRVSHLSQAAPSIWVRQHLESGSALHQSHSTSHPSLSHSSSHPS